MIVSIIYIYYMYTIKALEAHITTVVESRVATALVDITTVRIYIDVMIYRCYVILLYI